MSNATIEIPFAIGEDLWHCGYDPNSCWETCPACFGSKSIKMILGDGTEHVLDCEMCSRGYEPPRGTIQTHTHRFIPRSFTARSVSLDNNRARYTADDQSAYEDELFREKAECEALCAKNNAGREEEDRNRVVNNLIQAKKRMAWSVGYWSNQLRKGEQECERIRERLDVVKAHKKAKP